MLDRDKGNETSMIDSLRVGVGAQVLLSVEDPRVLFLVWKIYLMQMLGPYRIQLQYTRFRTCHRGTIAGPPIAF